MPRGRAVFICLCTLPVLFAGDTPVKSRALDLEMQLVSQQLDTVNALIAPLEREKAKHAARLNKLIDKACESAKIARPACQARIEDGHVILSETKRPAENKSAGERP